MKKGIKKAIAYLMSAVLTVGLFSFAIPQTVIKVKAEEGEKTVASLSTDAIINPNKPTDQDNAWEGNYVWYGKYDDNPVRYRVLDKKTDPTVFVGGTMFLDCDSILYESCFNADDADGNSFIGSDLEESLNGDGFLNKANGFTDVEKSAIAKSTVSARSFNANTYLTSGDWYEEYAAIDSYIFVLDADDILNPAYGYYEDCGYPGPGSSWHSVNNHIKKEGGSAGYWWLRSAAHNSSINAGAVYRDGRTFVDYVANHYVGVSPAFNLNLSSIIFSSKIKGTVGEKDAEYKLTIEDSKLNVALATSKNATISSNDIVTIPYTISGDNKNNATQVSVLVLNKEYKPGNTNNASIMYYGKLATGNTFSTTGEGTFDFAAFAAANDVKLSGWGTNYRVYILAEDVNTENDGKVTDYASKPIPVSAPLYVVETPTFSPTNGTYSGNQTVTISCETDGADIYYTTDGSDPSDKKGTKYTSAISVNSNTTIKAIAYKDGMSSSKIASSSYTLEYDVTLNAGLNMTKDTSFGETSQTVSCGSQINEIVFSADEGYYFPEDYSVDSVNGIKVERNSFKSIKVSGTPTDNATVTLKEAVAKTKADTPTLIATQPATINDKGSIPTTKVHEKSTDGVNWDECDGEWTDLSEGTYFVRERESDTKFASDAQTIIISVDKYVITFNNEDGKVLQKCEFACGDTPVYNGETPTKASTDTKVYTFNGWTPNITEVTGEAIYVATFSEGEKPKEPNTEELQAEGPKNPSEETDEPEKKADYLDELYAKLNNAKAQGGKQTVEWNAGDSLPYDVMKILEENKDITLVFSYTYGGEEFCVTISGENVKADPDVPWCGPLYLYSIYGDYTLGENGLQQSGTYIIKYGDTLTSLAAKFNTTIKNLVALNNIKDPDLIYAGDELKY